jgi:PAS domain S-box-containing protein
VPNHNDLRIVPFHPAQTREIGFALNERWRKFQQPVEILVIGLAYFIAGKLALLLAIPPGYATAVWPAAGLALGGVLVLGNRVWPGIVIGSFAVNVGTSLDPATSLTILRSVSLTAIIGTGAALQALTGAFLVRRYVGMPTALANENEVIRFSLLASASCLLAATMGVASLWLAGVLPLTDCLMNWATWWVGDTVGTLIFAPLIIIWRARARGWRRKISVAMPMGVAFVLVVALFFQASRWEQDHIKLEFDRRTDSLGQRVQRDCEGYLDVLRSIEGFLASSSIVDRKSFHTFVAGDFAQHPGIHALSWNAHVRNTERAAFEKATRRDGPETFQITEQDAHSNLVPALSRDEYIPVRYIEPSAGNESAIGFDVASDPLQRAALAWARDTGEPRATERTILVQDAKRASAFLVYLPIYDNRHSHDTVEERRQQLQGYVAAVFRIADMIGQSLKGMDRNGIELRLLDETTPRSKQLLFGTSGDNSKTAVAQKKTNLEMAGRKWGLEFSLSPDYLIGHRSWHSWNVLAEGLLFTALLGAFLLVVTGHKERDEMLVAERTSDLIATNAMLQREVAERTAAESQLRTSEVRFRSVTQSVADAIISADIQGRIVFWNHAAEKIFGYCEDEVIAKPLTLIIPERFRERHCAGLARLQAGGEGRVIGKTVELQGLRKDGTELPVELSLCAWRSSEGTFYTGIVRDISKRKEVEERLRRSEEQLRLLIESVQDYAIFMLDQNGRITTWNRGAERLKQYRSDEIIGQHFKVFYTAADQKEGLPDGLLAEAEMKGSVQREGVRVRKDGSEFRAETLISAVRDENGNLRGFSKVTRDITEQIQHREVAEKAQIEAERANEAKDRFLAILSHELRTPLTPVLAVVGYLAKQTSTLPRELRGEMEMIRRNVELEARLIDDLLDITKIARGKLELALEVTDAHAAIRHAFDICADTIKTKKLDVSLDLQASAHDVLADPVRLHQIFWNLISNAVKFTPAGERIVIRSRNEANKEFVFEVEDRGIGIAAETLPHIFEAFEQGDRFITQEFGGVGLGLAIIKALVESHHGRLEAFSEGRNAGSKFKLTLKAVAQENFAAASVEKKARKSTPLRILLVDDHEDTQRVFSRLLRVKGHEVFGAGNVASALKTLCNESIDVLVSDLGLPDGTGCDLMMRAQAIQPLTGIALSGFGMAEDITRAINAGFSHHLIKPVNFEQLEVVLNRVASKRTFRSDAKPKPHLSGKAS